MAGLVLVTAPVVEPVTLTEAKDHMRVDASTDDALIEALILAARERVETFTGRALVTQTWDWTLDCFEPILIVPKPPLVSVTSITYVDSDGASQTLASTVYQVDIKTQPARIVEAYGQTWPTTREQLNAVTIRFVAGYGIAASHVPMALRQAALLLIGHWYREREDTARTELRQIPSGAEALMMPYYIARF